MDTSAADANHTARTVGTVRTVEPSRTAGAADGADESRATDEWPVVPPAPTPTPPPPAQVGPVPPIIKPGASATPADAGFVESFEPVSGQVPLATSPLAVRLARSPLIARPGATVALRARPARRPIVVPSRADNQVWQTRFAVGAATAVLVPFAAVAVPFLIALYRVAGSPAVALSTLVPLGMVLLGLFVTAITTWVVVVEMRARVRMVDALGRTGEYEAPGSPGFSGMLRPFAQVPAQLGLLAVALALFVGAFVSL
ncbi:MAG TPA: hypothetical protein VH561_20285 [Micromonosporaceae bacterium]|jgi:hypothetical protein